MKGYLAVLFCIFAIAVFSVNSFAAITQDIDAAKNDVAYDYGLISNWMYRNFLKV